MDKQHLATQSALDADRRSNGLFKTELPSDVAQKCIIQKPTDATYIMHAVSMHVRADCTRMMETRGSVFC